MTPAAIKKAYLAVDDAAREAWRRDSLAAARTWVAGTLDDRPSFFCVPAILRRPGVSGSATPPAESRLGYDDAGRLAAFESFVGDKPRTGWYVRWDGDRKATVMTCRLDFPDGKRPSLSWYLYGANGRVAEVYDARDAGGGAHSTSREVFTHEGDRLVRVDVTEGDLAKWFAAEIFYVTTFDRSGALVKVTASRDGDRWVSYQAKPAKAAKPAKPAKPAKKPAVGKAAIAKAAKALAAAAGKRARARAKAEGEPVGAVALAYSAEGGLPVLGVLCEVPADRDGLNPAEWDGFDEDEDLDLEDALPGHVAATLDALDAAARRALINQAAKAIGELFPGAICFATDFALGDLDDNLRAVGAKLPGTGRRRKR